MSINCSIYIGNIPTHSMERERVDRERESESTVARVCRYLYVLYAQFKLGGRTHQTKNMVECMTAACVPARMLDIFIMYVIPTSVGTSAVGRTCCWCRRSRHHKKAAMLKEQEAIIVSGVTALTLEGDSVVDMTADAE